MASQHLLLPQLPPSYPPAQPVYGNSGGMGYNYRDMQEDFHRGPGGESHAFSGTAENISFMQANDATFQNADGILFQDSRSSYALPQYPPLQQPQYPQQYAYTQPAPTIPAEMAHSPPGAAVGFEYCDIQLYSTQPQTMLYGYDMPNHTSSYFTQQPKYNSPMASRPESLDSPMLMVPPIRIGFRSGDDTAVDHPAIARHHAKPLLQPFCRTSQHASSSANDALGPYPKQRNRGLKRPQDVLAEAEQFEIKRKSEQATRTLVGSCLSMPNPVKQPNSREKEKQSKKKIRRPDQPCLTSRTVKHGSNEEAHDADEEARLAVAASFPTAERIDIRYKDKVSRLESASDIAAWIEERRTRFPTKARREEKLQASRRALAEAETTKQRAMEARNDGEDAKEDSEVLLKLRDLKRRLRKHGRRIRAVEAKASRSKFEANHDGTGHVIPAKAQESKRSNKSAGQKGITALGNTAKIKREGADPLVDAD